MSEALERRLSPAVVLCALALTVVVLTSGYASLGFWTMLIFTSGFLAASSLGCAGQQQSGSTT